jgi:hypothetical protein
MNQRHPLAWFFALAFGIRWGEILVIVAARGFDLSPLQPVEGGLIFLWCAMREQGWASSSPQW